MIRLTVRDYYTGSANIRSTTSASLVIDGARLEEQTDGLPFIRVEPRVDKGLTVKNYTANGDDYESSALSVKVYTVNEVTQGFTFVADTTTGKTHEQFLKLRTGNGITVDETTGELRAKIDNTTIVFDNGALKAVGAGSGVTSIDTATGAFTLGDGLKRTLQALSLNVDTTQFTFATGKLTLLNATGLPAVDPTTGYLTKFIQDGTTWKLAKAPIYDSNGGLVASGTLEVQGVGGLSAHKAAFDGTGVSSSLPIVSIANYAAAYVFGVDTVPPSAGANPGALYFEIGTGSGGGGGSGTFKVQSDTTATGIYFSAPFSVSGATGADKTVTIPAASSVTAGVIKVGTGLSIDGNGVLSSTATGGVTSFNTRTGAITLTSSDVTTALTYTPYNATNPAGYITGITSGMVTTALGYTPYNASNPAGYITGITSGMVTGALGYTPYNSSNPAGYITSSVSGSMSVSGTVTASDFILSSDLRLKTDLKPLTGSLGLLDQIEAYHYFHVKNDRYELGVVAQEVREVLPDAVVEGEDGMLGVAYERLIPVLIAAVKELKAKVAQLEKGV